MSGFSQLGNGFIAWILNSPLHRLLSSRVLLLTLKGRKSGKTYTIPVEYLCEGDAVFVTTLQSRVWWRNLQGGAPVTVRMHGQDFPGHAQVTQEQHEPGIVIAAASKLYPRLNPAQREQFARDRVLVTIYLDR